MIRINVSEQQLFDMIMAVYATGSDGAQLDEEATQRREALLNKLHRAFDNKIMPQDQPANPTRRTSGRKVAERPATQPVA